MESNLTTEELQKKIRYYKWNIITNCILIVVILVIGIYVISELELFKKLGGDVCKMCTQKTGAICYLPIDIN